MRAEGKMGIVRAEEIKEGDLINFIISKNEIGLKATHRFTEQFKEYKK